MHLQPYKIILHEQSSSFNSSLPAYLNMSFPAGRKAGRCLCTAEKSISNDKGLKIKT
jgi:hypothetical protein